MTVYVANGTTVARGDSASPEVFTAVTQVTVIGDVGEESSLIDVTNLSSTLREWQKAIPDGLELQCVAQWDPDDSTQTTIRDTDRAATTARNWRVTFPDSPATTATFAALVTRAVVANAEIDNPLQFQWTLKPTGLFTWA